MSVEFYITGEIEIEKMTVHSGHMYIDHRKIETEMGQIELSDKPIFFELSAAHIVVRLLKLRILPIYAFFDQDDKLHIILSCVHQLDRLLRFASMAGTEKLKTAIEFDNPENFGPDKATFDRTMYTIFLGQAVRGTFEVRAIKTINNTHEIQLTVHDLIPEFSDALKRAGDIAHASLGDQAGILLEIHMQNVDDADTDIDLERDKQELDDTFGEFLDSLDWDN